MAFPSSLLATHKVTVYLHNVASLVDKMWQVMISACALHLPLTCYLGVYWQKRYGPDEPRMCHYYSLVQMWLLYCRYLMGRAWAAVLKHKVFSEIKQLWSRQGKEWCLSTSPATILTRLARTISNFKSCHLSRDRSASSLFQAWPSALFPSASHGGGGLQTPAPA